MKFLRTIVFSLLFAAAAAIYIFQAGLTRQIRAIMPDEVNRTVVIQKTDAVECIEILDSVQKTEVALRKEKGAWVLERPVRYPAESQFVEGFSVAARMSSQQPRLRAEKEWNEYGLENPELEIRFDVTGKGRVTLLLGASAPVGKAVFARWKEERGFFLLPPEMKSMFHQSVYALREKRLFRGPADGIRKIFVEMGGVSYEWRKAQGDWYWFDPVEKFGRKASGERMELVLQGLLSLHAREFLDNNKTSRAELGFFMIHDRIWVEYEAEALLPSARSRGPDAPSSQDGSREDFYFGDEVPDRNAYYGLLGGDDVVFLVDRTNVIAFFELLRKLWTEAPKAETKDLRS